MIMEDNINLLYNYLYNKNIQLSYKIDKIHEPNINNIKMVTPDEEIIKELFEDVQFQYIYANKYNQIYYYRHSSLSSTLVKVSFYKSKNDINKLSSAINNDSYISYLLSALVVNHKTEHILCPIMNMDVELSKVESIIPEKIMKIITDGINEKEYIDTCCIQIRERHNDMVTLTKYLETNTIDWKILLFQIMVTLSVIKNKYKHFRHNNLNLNSIFILHQNNDDIKEYDYNGKIYKVPNLFMIKIGDFEKTTMYDKGKELDDLAIFGKYLLNNNIKIDDETREFINLLQNNTINLKYFDTFIKPINIVNEEKKSTGSIMIRKISREKQSYTSMETNTRKIKKCDGYNNDTLSISGCRSLKKQHGGLMEQSGGNSQSGGDYTQAEIPSHIIRQNGGMTRNIIKPFKTEENSPFISHDYKETQAKRVEEPPKDTFQQRRDNQGPRKFDDRPPRKFDDRPQRKFDDRPPQQFEPRLDIRQEPRATEITNPLDTRETYRQMKSQQAPIQTTQQRIDDTPMDINTYDTNAMIKQMFPFAPINQRPMQVQKIYNVNLANPIGDHTTLNMIYEDMLPGTPLAYSSLTTFERCETINYLRSLMIDKLDGEEMSITGGSHSLLQYIKILDINPYSIAANPYKDMPSNMLLYRSAYPIKYAKTTGSVKIAKQSMGINVRIYKMSVGAFLAHNIYDTDLETLARGTGVVPAVSASTTTQQLNKMSWAVWRDLYYYDKVKNIVNNKRSPNFICPILYKIDTTSKIDWMKINMICNDGKISHKAEEERKLKPTNKDELKKFKNNLVIPTVNDADVEKIIKAVKEGKLDNEFIKRKQTIHSQKLFGPKDKQIPSVWHVLAENLAKVYKNNLPAWSNWKDTFTKLIPGVTLTKEQCDSIEKYMNEYRDPEKKEFESDSGTVLVLLTEAPTKSLAQWASSYSEATGALITMKETGYHSPQVWKSILFQLVYALAILETDQIYINNFNLRDNVYIKDVTYDANNIGSWIYNIDGLKYYVPNYGYVVMIDSKFNTSDKPIGQQEIIKFHNDNKTFCGASTASTASTTVGSTTTIIPKDPNYINVLDSNVFKELTSELKYKMPDTISKLLDDIKSTISATTYNIQGLLSSGKFFGEYLHNRVGTCLFVSEKERLIRAPINPRRGDLLIWEQKYDTYQWVVYLGKSPTNKKHNIYCYPTENNPETRDVFIGALYAYNSCEPVQHKPKDNLRYDEKFIFETYTL